MRWATQPSGSPLLIPHGEKEVIQLNSTPDRATRKSEAGTIWAPVFIGPGVGGMQWSPIFEPEGISTVMQKIEVPA